jgi:DNA-binding NarL/FixJ family response regulator
MPPLRSFLIVNDDSHARACVAATLLRHYPEAVVQECQDLNTAIELVRQIAGSRARTIVVAARTAQVAGRTLVEALRAANATIAIVWMGEPREAGESAAAGASAFLDKHAWLLIGQVVEKLL